MTCDGIKTASFELCVRMFCASSSSSNAPDVGSMRASPNAVAMPTNEPGPLVTLKSAKLECASIMADGSDAPGAEPSKIGVTRNDHEPSTASSTVEPSALVEATGRWNCGVVRG